MSANIKIGKLTIKSDPQCWTIYIDKIHEKGKNAGEEYEDALGYYPSLSTCLDAILERDFQDVDATEIKDLLKEVKSLKKQIKEIRYKGAKIL